MPAHEGLFHLGVLLVVVVKSLHMVDLRQFLFLWEFQSVLFNLAAMWCLVTLGELIIKKEVEFTITDSYERFCELSYTTENCRIPL